MGTGHTISDCLQVARIACLCSRIHGRSRWGLQSTPMRSRLPPARDDVEVVAHPMVSLGIVFLMTSDFDGSVRSHWLSCLAIIVDRCSKDVCKVDHALTMH